MFSVATEKSLSRQTSQGLLLRQSLHGPMSGQSFMCRDRLGAGRAEVRVAARNVRRTALNVRTNSA